MSDLQPFCQPASAAAELEAAVLPKRRTIVFPVEILARELDSKLLLTLCAKERGWKAVIGGQDAINDFVHRRGPCVYFGKSARSGDTELFAELKALGHQVVVLDEEALVRQSDHIFLMKHDSDALKNVDLLLTWGQDSREMWQRSGMLDGLRVETVGNPRVDMLLPQLRQYHQETVDDIERRYGDFVLFNSNFGTVNHKATGGVQFKLANRAKGQEVKKDAASFLIHKRALFDRFRLLVPKLAAAIAPRNLIIRPHPTEDHAPWMKAAANCPNVHVIFEGSVVPWIAAARVLIHNGCTSAIEAAIKGTSVVTYRPVTSSRFDNPLPNSMGEECFTDAAALEGIVKILNEGGVPLAPEKLGILRSHIDFGEHKLSSDTIFEAIERAVIGRVSPGKAPLGRWLAVYLQYQRRLLPKRLSSLSLGSRRNAYRRQKFSGLTEAMVNLRLARLQKSLNRFSGIGTRQIARDIIELI